MIAPGIDSYFPHFQELYDSAKILYYTTSNQTKIQVGEKNIDIKNYQRKMISPFILTMYSVLECLLSELEDRAESAGYELPYKRDNRTEITERPSELLKLLTGKTIDKGTDLYANYKFAIKTRNLITHASGEWIRWSSRNVMKGGQSVSMNNYYYSKKEFENLNLQNEIFRNKKADKIIAFLASKKLVPPYHQGRHTGWLHYISFPTVMRWYWTSILNYIAPVLIELSKTNDEKINLFSKQAQAILFDKILDENSYKPMKNEVIEIIPKKEKTKKKKPWYKRILN